MPTVISHSLVAIVFGKIFSKRTGVKFWMLSIICAILPDTDIILSALNIPYMHLHGHRGITHSITFALIIAFLVVVACFREVKHFSKEWWSFIAYFFLIGLSHDILDAMTSGGSGVGLFMPFDSTIYIFYVRPIRASPSQLVRLFETEGWQIFISELVWIWIPSVILLYILWFIKKRRDSKNIFLDDTHSK